MPRPYPSVRSGQHAGWAAVLEDGDGMLEVRRERPVLGHHRPFVVQGADVRTADVHHGLDGERHAGHEPGTALRLAVIRYLRVLVERRADPVSHQLPHHRVARAFRHLLHSVAGKSYSPLKDGRAPGCERMNSSAARSSCSVDTPGRTWRATRASVSATMRPAAAMVSISRGDLMVIIAR